MPYIIGIGSTTFGKHPNRSFQELAKEAVQSAMNDAQHVHSPQSIYFGNCAMHAFGQANIRGQTVLNPLFQDGLLEAFLIDFGPILTRFWVTWGGFGSFWARFGKILGGSGWNE